ncbi:hypothetical protein [Sediminicoccus sp. BL-A-41-H5]|uniref:hypothetical protein n=1 Tax=Sediminicoccus sp. BL-A-41-H5 TaxID=3421106 RepID=UPI003D66C4CA
MPGRPWIPLYAILLAGFAWVWASLPLMAIPNAGVDDALFVRHAALILSGQWLGPYTQFTLAKGVGYPLWLALTGGLSIPALLGQALLYAAAALLLVRALSRWIPQEGALFALLVLLLANPGLYGTENLRVIREGFYTPTLLLILALLLWWVRWSGEGLGRRLLLAAGLGLALGLFHLTREEGVWILPFLLGCLALRAVVLWRGWTPATWRAEAAALLACGVMAVLPVLAVSAMNARVYGVFRTVEFRDPAFIAAYSALARLGPAEPSLIVLPRARLPELFAASPAAAELASFFAADRGRSYLDVGCQTYQVTPCDDEFRAAWFMWALRDATVIAAGYADALAVRRFNLRLAEEVNAACARGELACLPPRHSLAPRFRAAYILPTLGAAWQVWTTGLAPPGLPDPRRLRSVYFSGGELEPRASAFLDVVRGDLFVDVLRPEATPPYPFPSLAVERATRLLRGLEGWMRVWAILGPVLQIAALLALLALPWLWRRHPERACWPVLALCVGAYLLYATRVALLAYLDTVAIPSVNMLYLSPAMPALLLGLALPLILLWRTLRPA